MNTYDNNTPIDILWNEYKTLCKQYLDMIPQKCVTTKACPFWLTGKIKGYQGENSENTTKSA